MIGNSLWAASLGSWVRVIETKSLMGRETAKVMIEGTDRVVTVNASTLLPNRPLDLGQALSTVAAARTWAALGSDLFLSPLVSKVLPLPHQFRVLRKVMEQHPVRMMCADEVGLGKTIEAGLVLKELKLRGLAERVLVMAPKSLLLQWMSEMETLFGERFELVLPGDWGASVAMRGDNEWRRFNQVVTSYDSVKPKETHKGWDQERIERYNLERFHDLIGAGWDLVILDEAHKMAGSSDDVARYALAEAVARAAPNVLLLTATPHSGKSDAFRRLLALLDPPAFAEGAPITRETVSPYVVRTDKRSAVDADGKALFAPRSTRLIRVPFEPRHALQEQLYQDVSTYVVEGYRRAEREGNKGSRLLLILIQRLVSSSTRAVRSFLERRLEALLNQEEAARASVYDSDATGEELEQSSLFYVPTSSEEAQELQALLLICRQVEMTGPDVRAEALLEQMRQLVRQDSEPDKKFLVFTEFTQTQEMLREFLTARGYEVVTLNGSMDLEERRLAQAEFRENAQVLIMTDAGAEGLNMQFAHVVINYDLPWAPMRVEQRIGRVDRIGQKREVVAINLVLENSVEARVYEVWLQKLALILEEFGVDKAGDVLDSSEANAQFERLAQAAMLQPATFDSEFDQVVTDLRRAAVSAKESRSLFESELEPADRLPTIPIAAWLDTISRADQLTLDADMRGADLSADIIAAINDLKPYFATGKDVPVIELTGLGFELDGWFGLWKVGIADGAWRQQRVFPVYISPKGESFPRTAERLWDALAARTVVSSAIGETVPAMLDEATAVSEQAATEFFDAIVERTKLRAKRRLASLEISYLQRRSALSGIGLDNVRESRRRDLESEYKQRRQEIESMSELLPELECLIYVQVTGT